VAIAQVLRDLRERGSGLPVVVLTARDAVTDRVAGLDAGADDYLAAFRAGCEPAARVRAVLRRKGGRASTVIVHDGLCPTPRPTSPQDGASVPVSPREFALLHALLERPGQILSRGQLEDRLYGWGEEVESNVVEVHIHALRRKLGADFIRNVRGVGYRVRPAQQ
jgi:DNA-binding response OmpR family regulator